MKKIIILIAVLSLVFMLTSCFPNGDYFRSKVSGDFVYSHASVSNPDENVAIIGLSEEGKKKETIVFPTSLDGYNVSKVGAYLVKRSSGPIIFKNARNIYFTNISFRTYNEFEYDKNVELNIYIGGGFSWYIPNFPTNKNYPNSKVFVTKKYYDRERKFTYFNKYNYIPANITYYLNDEYDNIFFVDDVDGKLVNVIPPNPIRDGYKFVGWYKDTEGTIPWNFEKDTVPKKIYDENGEYIFKETKIFAKWIKNRN